MSTLVLTSTNNAWPDTPDLFNSYSNPKGGDPEDYDSQFKQIISQLLTAYYESLGTDDDTQAGSGEAPGESSTATHESSAMDDDSSFMSHAPFVAPSSVGIDEPQYADTDADSWAQLGATVGDEIDTDDVSSSDTSDTVESTTADPKYAALDDFIDQHEGDDLTKWNDMASADQGIQLERPIAAMQILSGKVDGATDAMKQAALQYINDNPSLKSAAQRVGALKDDGTVDQDKMGAVLQQVHTNLEQADNNIRDYMNKHPDADPDSLATVQSAALVQAYVAIAGESTGHQDTGGKNNSYEGGKNGGMVTSKQQISDLQNNAGFSDVLKNAAKVWSTDGGFDAIDRAGVDKATNKADGLINDDNLTSFIKDEAPSDEQSDLDFLRKAGLKNITANTDISNLNQDIFTHPGNYTPEQKAAVMVKLMEMLINVKAGGNDGLRNVEKTVKVLAQDIQTLANDPAVGEYLKQKLPPAMQQLAQMFEKAGGSGAASADGVDGTDSDGSSSSNVDPNDVIDGIKDGAKAAKQIGSSVARGVGAAAEGAASEAGDMASKIASTAARLAGSVAGEAAAGIVGAVSTALDALGPIGEIAGVIATIVTAIIEAVQKGQNQQKFADNVNPTLQQFGIPLPT
ncbi:hypothetical protein DFQ28_010338 [Apophysomyces sp. BC1034]|nr:hypothetical protein DFQ28_010338 [Apophysomyces sp. BC1034]